MQNASPTSEQDQDSSKIEIMSPSKLVESVIHKKKRRDVIHQVKSSQAMTHPVAPTSCSDVRSASMPVLKSKPPSPSAEHISWALKTQQLPTNKEMSSFHMSLVFS